MSAPVVTAAQWAELLTPAPKVSRPSSPEEWESGLDAEWHRRLLILEAAEDDPEVQRDLYELGRTDPVWWISTFIYASDPRRLELELETMLPFVLWPHQVEVLEAVLAWCLLAVDKPRGVGLTILVLAAFLWAWLYVPGARFGVSSTKLPKIVDGIGEHPTEDSLFGKLLHMLHHLPAWMISRNEWDFTRGQGQPTLVNLRNNNSIAGEVATHDAFHGPRKTAVLFDELARVRHAGTVMKGVQGATNSIIGISTPNGRAGWWPRLIHGDGPAIRPYSAQEKPERGTWHHIRLTVEDDPRYDEVFQQEKRAELGDEAYEEQYGVSYDAKHLPGLIWPDFRRSLHVYDEEDWTDAIDQGLLDDLYTVDVIDPGIHCAYLRLGYSRKWRCIIVLGYLLWHDRQYDEIVADIARHGWYCEPDPELASPELVALGRAGTRPDARIIDRAGTQRVAGLKTTAQKEFARRGLKAKPVRNDRVDKGNERVGHCLRYDALHFAPQCAERLDRRRHGNVPTLVDCVESYRKDVRGPVEEHVGDDPTPVKDMHSHAADCARYGVWHLVGDDTETSRLRWSSTKSAWLSSRASSRRTIERG